MTVAPAPAEVVGTGLVKAYPGRPPIRALRQVDLVVPGGSLLAILGPSGCGKTTLLRVLAGFERADAGEIRVGDRLVEGPGTHVPPERRQVGIVPQEGALFPHLDVAGNVAFGLPRRPGRRARVAEMLELVGLAGHERRRPHELSGGQQQRVALARALAPRPAVVLLDEPFAALDTDLRATLRTEVARVLRATGATAVMVTHDQTEALAMADEVALMRAGRIIQAGAPRRLYQDPVDLDAARALGPVLILAGEVRRGTARCVLGAAPLRSAVAEGAVQVLVRPEQVAVLPGDGDEGVPATVGAVTFYGHDAVVHLQVAAGAGGAAADPALEVTARVAGYEAPSPGASVRVAVRGRIVAFPAPSTSHPLASPPVSAAGRDAGARG